MAAIKATGAVKAAEVEEPEAAEVEEPKAAEVEGPKAAEVVAVAKASTEAAFGEMLEGLQRNAEVVAGAVKTATDAQQRLLEGLQRNAANVELLKAAESEVEEPKNDGNGDGDEVAGDNVDVPKQDDVHAEPADDTVPQPAMPQPAEYTGTVRKGFYKMVTLTVPEGEIFLGDKLAETLANSADMDKQLIMLSKGAPYWAQIKRARYGHYQVLWHKCHNIAFDSSGNTWAMIPQQAQKATASSDMIPQQAQQATASNDSSGGGDASKKRKLDDQDVSSDATEHQTVA